MPTPELVALAAAIVLGLLIYFQLALAAGLPLGRAAWGGHYRVLPARLRWASLGATGLLALAIWIVLARAGLVAPGSERLPVRIAGWIFAAYLAMNTVGNLLSKSPIERAVMTPVSTFLALCFVIVSLD